MSASSTTNSCILRGQDCGSATNFPQFIDSAACLCGLLDSREPVRNGGLEEDWRCIGDASANLESGGNGKWFNTSLPSQELSGISQPQYWDDNPPDLSQTYVLEDVNGRPKYETLGSNGSPQLIADDSKCTGKNSTELSAIYYSKGKNAPAVSSSSIQSSSSTSVPSSTSTSRATSSSSSRESVTPSSTPSPSISSSTSTSSSSTSSSASPSSTSGASSKGPRNGFKTVMLLGMVLAPMVATMV
ncbi:MAG: hypothetical protein Q9163_004519 [Psora crenata]